MNSFCWPPSLCSLAVALVCGLLAACGGPQVADTEESPTTAPVAEFDRMPSGVAVYGERVFVSLPRWFDPGDGTVYEWLDGSLVPFPSAAANDLASGASALHSVNGLHVDRHGRLWMLDNGRIDLGPADGGVPKVVVWDLDEDAEAFRIVFQPDIAAPSTSFLNDLVVDEDHGFAYITESGLGGTPALIVVDLLRDRAWRALEGAEAVSADPDEVMTIDGQTVNIWRGGEPTPWRVAANPIALSVDAQTLYFGAMTSRTLWAIPTRALRDETLSNDERVAQVSVARADKPITDGMARCPDGSLVFTDVENERVLVEEARGGALVPVGSPRMSFPVAVECTDDALWVTSNQLHRLPLLHNGEDQRVPPYFLWRWDR